MREHSCNKFRCDETYTAAEVRDTRFCPDHQPTDVYAIPF